jgi:hypothetical protein
MNKNLAAARNADFRVASKYAIIIYYLWSFTLLELDMTIFSN